MRLFLTHHRNRTAWQATALAFVLLAAITLSAIYPIIQAHAQDCIGGGDPDPDPTNPPDPDPTDPLTISASLTLVPAYPITLGQDPDDRGVDVRGITARGGMHHCPNGGPARIVAFSVVRVQLAQSSIAWINGTLARKYPGAHVTGSYPFTPNYTANGIGSGQAQLSFHLAPLDPGYYEVTVQATQEDGQSANAILRVPVYLLESSIIE